MTERKLTRAQDAFRRAANTIYAHSPEKAGIGTQGERMLHAIIKHYVAPDPTCHEQKVGRRIVDAMVDGHIYEVQTRRFDRLIPKLEALLPSYPVTVLYPIAVKKQVCWLDPETGSVSKGRVSPKKGKAQDALYEIFYIKELLLNPNLTIRLILCDMQEYRTLTGYGKDKKRRAPRAERTPGLLQDDITLATPSDYAKLLPEGMTSFTVKELTKAWHTYPICTRRGIQVLLSLGVIFEDGKRGREKQYTVRGTQDGSLS